MYDMTDWTVVKEAVPRRPLIALAVLAILVIAGALPGAATATTTSCNNAATLAGSAFEIDTSANLVVNTTGCIDWLTGGSGTPFRAGVQTKLDSTGQSDDSFGQGTAEDNPNPTITTGSIPPNKSDLKAFGVYTEDIAGTTNDFLDLFWSRVQNPSGTTNMDFELNKLFCDGTATNCANNGTKNPVYVTPKRSVGDKLITYDLSKGGTVPTISIRTWTGSAWDTANKISGGQNADALGSVNSSSTPIPATDTGGLGSQDPFTFGEAAIKFSALFGTGACGSFGSAYLKSRSSDSFTAEIKDFVAPEQVHISNCESKLSTVATSPVTIGSPISDTADLNVGAGVNGTITFHLYRDVLCSSEVTTGLTPVTVNGPGFYNSGNFTPALVGTYYWIAVYSGSTDGTTTGATSACGEAGETSIVNPAASSMTTVQSFIPNDSATVSAPAGGNLAGRVTFELFESSDCTGNAIYTTDPAVPVSGASPQTVSTSNTTVSTTAANVSWRVTYTSTNTGQKNIPASCVENTALTINNDGTVVSP
jgi:hypothetical protein